jgi:hypothetical protein
VKEPTYRGPSYVRKPTQNAKRGHYLYDFLLHTNPLINQFILQVNKGMQLHMFETYSLNFYGQSERCDVKGVHVQLVTSNLIQQAILDHKWKICLKPLLTWWRNSGLKCQGLLCIIGQNFRTFIKERNICTSNKIINLLTLSDEVISLQSYFNV